MRAADPCQAASGHGLGSTQRQALDSRADTFAFLLWRMGVPGFELKG